MHRFLKARYFIKIPALLDSLSENSLTESFYKLKKLLLTAASGLKLIHKLNNAYIIEITHRITLKIMID